MLSKNELGYLGQANEELYDLLSGGEIKIKETVDEILITADVVRDGVMRSRVMIDMSIVNGSVFGWVTSHDDDARFWYGSRSLHPMTWAFVKRILELQ
jgi:hypothetical protein